MADRKKSVPQNVVGEFFVDTTCIDCDTCRQLAPGTFEDAGEYSFVYAQPSTEEERRNATRALLACPTGSIGTGGDNQSKAVMADFPLPIEDDVYYCGFNSAKSYGGNSYFVKHKDGNWLIDSPKYLKHLVERFDQMGGVAYIFLTHRDDVADSQEYAKRFGSKRIIHRDELSAAPDCEIVLEGDDLIELFPQFKVIPTSGHTRGHCVLLYGDRFLFSGDHLWWSRENKRLDASKSVCWYSWPEQTRSMEKLKDYRFEWVLCGHGQRIRLPAEQMKNEINLLVERMKSRK